MSEDRTRLASGGEEHLAALHSGYRLGRYELQAVLGHGGFGITYRAWDSELDRAVAIKEYLPSDISIRVDGSTVKAKSGGDRESFEWGLERFIAEARALARFERSGAIVRVYDYLQANGTAYMVMALVEGEPLSALYRREAPLAEERLKAIVLPVLEGLEDVHRAGFLHRDIKPSNILIRPGGEPVLIDFGAARQALGEKSRSITSVFTPGYAPFEQYTSSGRQGPWTDIYALSATLYHGVTGRIPPQATDRIREDGMEPAIRAGAGRYSEPFLAAIDAGLQVFEDRRPQTLAQWRAMLTGEVATVAPASITPSHPPSVAAAPPPRTQPPTQPPISQGPPPASIAPATAAPARRRLVPLIAAGLLVLAVGAGAAVTLLSPGSGGDEAVAETAQARAERLRAEAERAGEEARKAQEAAEAEIRRQQAQEAQQLAAEQSRREAEAAAARQAEEAKAAAEKAQREGDAEAARRAEDEARQAAAAEAAQRLAAEQAEKDRKALELARQKAEAELAEARRAAEEARRLTEELRAQAETARRAAAEERQRLEAEAKSRAEAEARAKQEAEARQKAEAEAKAKAKAEADAKAKEEAEAKAKVRAEAEAKAKEEAAARQKAEAEARRKAETETRVPATASRSASPAPAPPAPAPQQAAAPAPQSAPADPRAYVETHWERMRPVVQSEVYRLLSANNQRMVSIDGYEVAEVTSARIRLRVFVTAGSGPNITDQRTLNVSINNTPPRFSAGSGGASPVQATAPQQQAAASAPAAATDPGAYVDTHWQRMRPVVQSEIYRQLNANHNERLISLNSYEVVEMTPAHIRLRVFVTAAQINFGSINHQRTLNVTLNNTPPRFSVAGGGAAPVQAAAPQQQAAAPAPTQSQAGAGYEFSGAWTLTLDCPTAMRRQLPPIGVAISGPRFSARFGSDGQASGQIADGRLALRLSFTTEIGESIKGELALNQRDGAFSGGGLLTGFGAATYGGGGGGGDRQCMARMAR
ncbi:MAG: serine/threonine-protein kinase [Reyranellaceae bacterium]